jgi:hypothetical protein
MDVFKKQEKSPAVSEPDKPLSLSKQDLADVVAAAVRAANQLNPIEQRNLEQELAAQERRDKAAVQLAKIEMESAERKKNACSHSRHPMAMGRMGGHAAPKGTGEWTTSGQCHSTKLATLICVRCACTCSSSRLNRNTNTYNRTVCSGWLLPQSIG